MSVADEVKDLERRIEKLERENRRLEEENGRLESQLDSAQFEARDFERSYYDALERVEALEADEHLIRPARPDVKRVDRGDWTRAMSSCVCDICGFQFWEHAPVPGYMWMHRICDGRLVKL